MKNKLLEIFLERHMPSFVILTFNLQHFKNFIWDLPINFSAWLNWFVAFDSTITLNVNVKILLKHGANVNATTGGGATPLHRAAYQGHKDVVETLLNAGANPDMQVWHLIDWCS